MERLTERTAVGILVKEDYGKEVLKTLYSCYGGKPNPHYTNCEEGYCAMEKLAGYEDAEEQGMPIRWIPCSERLPETSGYYLACVYDSDVDDFDFRKNWFAHKDDYDMDESEWRELQPFEMVTAWMPLPKPYSESEESNKQTNADRIRSMTDEELAGFLKEVKGDYQWANPDYPDCEDCGEWVKWLQLEAEQEE